MKIRSFICLLAASNCLGQPIDLAITNLSNESYEIDGNGNARNAYSLQFKDDLSQTNWHILGWTNAGETGAFMFIDTNGSPERFYRAALTNIPVYSPTNIAGMAYYWDFHDLPYNVMTTGWTDRLQHVVLTNYQRTAYDPTNTALGLMLPNYGSASCMLTNSSIAIGSNFTLWMVIRERLNVDQLTVPQYSCLFGSYDGHPGLMLSNGIIGCDWGNASGTVGGVMMSNWPIDLVYSQGKVYTNGVALSGTLPQPTNNFKFQAVGDIYGSGPYDPFVGYIQYIGIWTNMQFAAADVSNLDNWVNTNGVSNITSGLTAWWKMNDGAGASVFDSSGTGYNGTISGGSTWLTTAPTGGGLAFNGTNSLVTTTNVPGTWTNMSLVFWINCTHQGGSTNGVQAIPIGHSANQTKGGNGGPGWQAYFEDYYMRFLTLDASGHFAEVANQYYIENGRWHQCVLEIGASPANVFGYTDGEMVTLPIKLSGTPSYIATNIPVTMGSFSDPKDGYWPYYFDGSLADVRIYTNHVLNAQEVADLFRWRGQP